MSNFDNNPLGGADLNPNPRATWPTSTWVAGLVVVVVVLFGIGYLTHDRWMGATGVHNAAVTDVPAPATAPVTPLPKMTPVVPSTAPSAAAATPAATPKP